MSASISALGLLLSPLAAASPTPTDTHDFVRLSFTGNGSAPSALEMFEAQARGPKEVDAAASASDKGDAVFSFPLPLPPAHVAPELAISYSSAAGYHSVLGRGWSLSSGMSVSRPSGRAATHAYADVPGVHLVQGGGLDGLLVPAGSGWRYVSSTPAAVSATYDAVGRSWTIDYGGRVTTLSARDDVDWSQPGLEPTRWEIEHAVDRHGNEVSYLRSGGRLEGIEYGGRPAQGEPHSLQVYLDYDVGSYPRSFQAEEGWVDVIDSRLQRVEIWTQGVLRRAVALGHSTIQGVPLLTSIDLEAGAEVQNLYTFDYTRYTTAADAYTTGSWGELPPPFLSYSTLAAHAGPDHSNNKTRQGLYDVSGDGLLDLLDCFGQTCKVGWYLWGAGEGQGEWEDPDTSARTFSLPPNVDGLELTENREIGQYTVDQPEYGAYTKRAVVDLNGDGFLDLLVVQDDEILEFDANNPPPFDPWVANLAVGSHTWLAYLGGPNGFDGPPLSLQAPFRAIRISSPPYSPNGPKNAFPATFDAEGPVVDLMDLNGDGWQDVVYVDPTQPQGRLRVWTFDPAGDWLSGSGGGVVPMPPDMDARLVSTSTSLAHRAPEGRYLDATVELDPDTVYVIASMDGRKGFMDLNGDGFQDFVDTSYWVAGSNATWDVWLGNGVGFDEKRQWPARLGYFSRSVEGFPYVWSCSFSAGDFEFESAEMASLTGGGGMAFPQQSSGSCNDVEGTDQELETVLMDMDGDGRPDLVRATTGFGRRWYRNEGDGFDGGALLYPDISFELPSWFPADAVGRFRTEQDVIVSTNLQSGTSGSQSSATYGRRHQHAFVGDLNGDGLPDSVIIADDDYTQIKAHFTTGTRPGLLASITRGAGAETTLSYTTSAAMWPSGTADVPEHTMSAHRDVVTELTLWEPVTKQGHTKAFTYEDGYCEAGTCWGFAKREVEHRRHDPLLHFTGFSVPLLRTTIEYELARDWVLPSHEVHEVDWSLAWTHNLGLGLAKWGPRYETTYSYADHGPAAPHGRWLESRVVAEHPHPDLAGAPRTVTASLEYDPVGNVVAAHHEVGLNHPDNISVFVEYVSDATETLWRPKRHRTHAWDVNSSVFRDIENGTFAYDGQPFGASPTAGDLTAQWACAGLPTSLCGTQLSWTFTWHGRGALAAAHGPAGFATYVDALTFGGLLPTEERNALGHLTQTAYDPEGRVDEVIDANGVVQRTSYDAFGRVSEERKQGAGGVELKVASYTYHDDVVPRHVTITRYAYDELGAESSYQEHQVLDGLGRVVQSWRADEYGTGWIVTEEVADLSGSPRYTGYPHRETTFVADLDQTAETSLRTVNLSDAFGATLYSWEDYSAQHGYVRVRYPTPGVVRSETREDPIDPVNFVHEAHHDAHGRLVEVWEGQEPSPLVRTGTYQYDGRGRIVRFTDGNGNRYRFDFDGAGRQRTVRRAPPSGSFQTYYAFKYDGPYPTQMAAGTTTVAEWTYDALGRSVEKRVRPPGGGTVWDTYTWSWDTAWIGARASVTDPRGEVAYSYDPHPIFGKYGWPTEVVRQWDDLSTLVGVTRAYDHEGREVSATWPSGAVVSSYYSPTGWLIENEAVRPSAPLISVLHKYDHLGMPSGFVGGEPAHIFDVTMYYYTPSRPSSLEWRYKNGLKRKISWTYSVSGLLKSKQITPYEPFYYDYDALQRITSVRHNSPAGPPLEGYAYDTIGNPVAGQRYWDGDVAYGAAPKFNEIPSRATNGSNEHETLRWDPQGRVSRRTLSVNGSLDRVVRYGYDGAGRLASTETALASGGPSIWALLDYDVDDRVVREHRADDAYQIQEIYRFDGWWHEAVSGQTIESVLPMAKLVDGVVRWTMLEPDGHALETFSSNGASQSFEIAGVFGLPLPEPGPIPGKVFSDGTPWRIEGLHGLENDRYNGHVHAGARHFLMRDGMWLQPEPLLHQGFHGGNLAQPLLYGGVYARGNTNTLEDSSGRHPILIPVIAFVAKEAATEAVVQGAYAVDPTLGAVVDVATTFTSPTKALKGAASKLTGAAGAYAKRAAPSGLCFVGDTSVVAPGVAPAIQDMAIGDRVLAFDEAAAFAFGDEPWIEVDSTPSAKPGAWAPRGICHRVRRWARTAVVPAAMLAACDVVELPAPDEIVRVYDARTGEWFEAVGATLRVGDTYFDDGRVLRVTEGGVVTRGEAAISQLAEADATWIAEAAHRVPGGPDWVLVLGEGDAAGHWRLSDVEPGGRFAFQGRVFETADVDADGALEIRATGDVLGEVVNTFVRVAPEVIDAEITYPDGTTDTLTGTPSHPFWVGAVRDYVPLGELQVGTQLHVQGGGEAILVSKTWRQGDFEVFDFEVAGLHNFYVRGQGSAAAGVLVHNSTATKGASNVHGNANASMKPQHGYEISRVDGGDVGKTGISGQPLNQNGTSPRANQQVNKLNKEAGAEVWKADVVETDMPGRTAAKKWEQANTNRLYDEGNSMDLHKRPTPE